MLKNVNTSNILKKYKFRITKEQKFVWRPNIFIKLCESIVINIKNGKNKKSLAQWKFSIIQSPFHVFYYCKLSVWYSRWNCKYYSNFVLEIKETSLHWSSWSLKIQALNWMHWIKSRKNVHIYRKDETHAYIHLYCETYSTMSNSEMKIFNQSTGYQQSKCLSN